MPQFDIFPFLLKLNSYNINMTNYKNRKSIRLKNYDYTKNGLYFVTICIQNREHLLGEIIDGQHTIYDSGKMIHLIWNNLGKHIKGVTTYEFVVMPNHVHGIISLENSSLNLSEIIRRFKTFTTRQYIKHVGNSQWQPFSKRLWQRNYYEHIIRNEESLEKLRIYIENNPLKWDVDVLNG